MCNRFYYVKILYYIILFYNIGEAERVERVQKYWYWLDVQNDEKIICQICQECQKLHKQAGAGAVPSSGLVDSWVKIYSFFVGDPKQETGWSLDEVKIKPW